MKADLHPTNYRPVLFWDSSSNTGFVINSTVRTNEKRTYEGTEYDTYTVEISSASHPFYTGEQKIMDAAGRVDKFKARAAKAVK